MGKTTFLQSRYSFPELLLRILQKSENQDNPSVVVGERESIDALHDKPQQHAYRYWIGHHYIFPHPVGAAFGTVLRNQ